MESLKTVSTPQMMFLRLDCQKILSSLRSPKPAQPVDAPFSQKDAFLRSARPLVGFRPRTALAWSSVLRQEDAQSTQGRGGTRGSDEGDPRLGKGVRPLLGISACLTLSTPNHTASFE